ncbi:MAG: MFS transporter [Candidatus Heimdallarchaeota archaeon]|nr:MFS transporter [Candidatus Heimdallarchaeota archaeon]
MSVDIVSIGKRNVFLVMMISVAGQIAWAVENTWFNTFVYDRITKDPRPVAWMVAVSAATATLTTIYMGTRSDRTTSKYGRRKPYIVLGYILWGLITIIYPMIEWVESLAMAVFLVISVDAIMTFFGSTANDAAFNAWVTDRSHSSNRNRYKMMLDISALLANVIAIAAAGIVIDTYGYFTFFLILGAYVSLIGLLSHILMPADIPDPDEIPDTPLWVDIKKILDPQLLRDNRTLFLLLVNMAITGIATQIYFPYLFTYLEYYIGMGKDEIAIYAGVLILGMIVVTLVVGLISHHFNRWKMILWGTIFASIFTVVMGVLSPAFRNNPSSYWYVIGLYLLANIPAISAAIAHGGWLLDSYPKGDVGRFQGIRMIFFVAIPMMIGPIIGAFIIRNFGTTLANGDFVPDPMLFVISGCVMILAIIPILKIDRSEGGIKFKAM